MQIFHKEFSKIDFPTSHLNSFPKLFSDVFEHVEANWKVIFLSLLYKWFQKKLKAQVKICEQLFKANRVDFISEADFRKGSNLYKRTCLLLDYVIAKIRYTTELDKK